MAKKQVIDKQNLNPILVLAGLVLIFLIIGFACGVFYSNQSKRIDKSGKLENTDSILKTLNSEVVPSIISYGMVTSINNREITMVFNKDPITIKVKEDASIRNMGENNDKSSSQSDLNQIKVGDTLNAEIKINTDGVFESNSIIVFPK
jgi:hypothetical protein